MFINAERFVLWMLEEGEAGPLLKKESEVNSHG